MGIYVHVPFCRSKCFYCGFYSVASLKLKEAYLKAIEREIDLRKGYLPEDEVHTLYFGGGTPSYLEWEDLKRVVATLEANYSFVPGAERTIELNPEDLTEEKLRGIRDLGFNRLSIGVQSFSDEQLKRINRTHSAQQAREGIELAANMGFDNISMDLIIGLPGQTEGELLDDVEKASRLPIAHLSVYMLSIDSNTVFEHMVKRGEFRLEDEEVMAERYQRVCERLKESGFEHYEISNFARKGLYSRHNMKYWTGGEYLGFGPSASSDFAGKRFTLKRDLQEYIAGIRDGGDIMEDLQEIPMRERAGEYLMLRLRTSQGISAAEYEKLFLLPFAPLEDVLEKRRRYYQATQNDSGRWVLTPQGYLVSNDIITDLLIAQDSSHPLKRI